MGASKCPAQRVTFHIHSKPDIQAIPLKKIDAEATNKTTKNMMGSR